MYLPIDAAVQLRCGVQRAKRNTGQIDAGSCYLLQCVCVCVRTFMQLCGHILVQYHYNEDVSSGHQAFKELFEG